jgi:hypothetical protein
MKLSAVAAQVAELLCVVDVSHTILFHRKFSARFQAQVLCETFRLQGWQLC